MDEFTCTRHPHRTADFLAFQEGTRAAGFFLCEECAADTKIVGDRILERLQYRGDNEEEVAAHRVFEAQLRYTASMIDDGWDHYHFVDDCGDYLRSALRLSSLMQDARMDGTASLVTAMESLLEPAPDYDPFPGDTPFDRTTLRMDYAGDGVCSELIEWAELKLTDERDHEETMPGQPGYEDISYKFEEPE